MISANTMTIDAISMSPPWQLSLQLIVNAQTVSCTFFTEPSTPFVMQKPQPTPSSPLASVLEPLISEAQGQVLRFIIKLSRQPHQRARAQASILMAWNQDQDFDLIYPIVEFYWMEAIGYFQREKHFNPSRDQDRIVEYVIERLAKRFPDIA